jgi:ABC-2 type transport system permease protein
MRKYLYILKIAIQDNFSDAGKTFIWILGESTQAFVFIFTWITVAGGRDTIGETPVSNLVTYYLFIFINWFIIGGFSHMLMANSIRQGTLSNQLTRPIIPFSLDILKEQGWKFFGLVTSMPLLLILIVGFRSYIQLEISLQTILYTIPAIIMGAVVFALMDFLVAFSAFWTTRVSGTRILLSALNSVLGGYLIPFYLLPLNIQNIATWLPFRYTFAFPAQIFQESVQSSQILTGYVLQFSWIIILLFVVYTIFKIGMQQFEANGG